MKQIEPILTKYCAGCHRADDPSGELALDSHAGLERGGETGAVITAGNSASSRLIGVLTGAIKPAMPPEDEPRPTPEEIDLLKAWIDAGARGPEGKGSTPQLRVPKFALNEKDVRQPITAIAYSPDGKFLALGRFGRVELRDVSRGETVRVFEPHADKVNDVRFNSTGNGLVTASGITGLYGESLIWDMSVGTPPRTLTGAHRDVLYAAVVSPDDRLVATAGYDQRIVIWDYASGQRLRELSGHNGAVFDLAFTPDGKILTSASADATIKVWNTDDGSRLDTRSEPLKEQLTTAIDPTGSVIVGGGEDNRIRLWKLVSRTKPEINPLVHARFAHEGAIDRLRFSPDGRWLVSSGRDRIVKVWDAQSLREVQSFPDQPDDVQCLAVAPDSAHVSVGRLDGSYETYAIEPAAADVTPAPAAVQEAAARPMPRAEMQPVAEIEPNDLIETAQVISLPAQIAGTIDSADAADRQDADLFRFTASAGQVWVLEVNAQQQKSPLDSLIDILDSAGKPVLRVQLQAIRDSYLTFRGKDSYQTGDFRLHNWEEMRLDQFLYCQGEVVKLFYYPRGPDSGFNLYPNFGPNRHTYFDTTALAHPLNEACYIVEPLAPAARPIPNGLPVFPIYYQNDDDSEREIGSDSRLTFTVPASGQYIGRIRDTRGFQGTEYRYQLAIRPQQPDFRIKEVSGSEHAVPRNGGRKFTVEIDRIDGFDGPVELEIGQLPPGFHATSPLTVEPGQLFAWGQIWCDAIVEPPAADGPQPTLTATAMIDGQKRVKDPIPLGPIKLADPAKVLVRLGQNPPTGEAISYERPPVVEVRRGTTTTMHVAIERTKDFNEHVGFGSVDGAQNAPHGVYIDNIGLNGVLIPADQTERVIFLTADPCTALGDRLIFLETNEAGYTTSNSVILRVID